MKGGCTSNRDTKSIYEIIQIKLVTKMIYIIQTSERDNSQYVNKYGKY